MVNAKQVQFRGDVQLFDQKLQTTPNLMLTKQSAVQIDVTLN